MKLKKQHYKLLLPNGKVVDIISDIIIKMMDWTQMSVNSSEAGGYILGYEHLKTGNITLEDVSTPRRGDNRSRFHIVIKDVFHFNFIKRALKKNSFYMGLWHTHPQKSPTPSSIDLNDWQSSLLEEKTACDYIFFIILGTEEFRVWAGDFKQNRIIEILEYDSENKN